MTVDRYEIATCDRVTAARLTSWGALKLLYR
jgi:hypothetical protein